MPELNDDDKNLIFNFLKKFAPPEKEKPKKTAEPKPSYAPSSFHGNQIGKIKPQHYETIAIADDMQGRIDRLRRIADGIENYVITPKKKQLLPKGIDFKVDYKNSLNANQYLAATTTEGPLLVIAGAGSGKTHTVVFRVSFLLEKGVAPDQILLLTFTRKAATEMVKRTARLLQDDRAENIMRGTYHAFSNYLLRRFSSMLGIASNFTIIDTVDAEDIIDLIRNELKFAKKSKAFPRKSRVQGVISKSRNCNITIEEVLEREYTGLLEFSKELNMIKQAYQQYKEMNNLFDYDDLMETLRNKLRDNLPFRRRIQQMYRYVMVDEFQDSNVVQKQIVDFIAEKHRNIMVVGDDAQSIYAFRGANFENILTFPSTYPDCKVVKLEQNYRSTQNILQFTNNIANNALLGYKKSLTSAYKANFKPTIAKFFDQEQEAHFIVDKIMELRERNIPLNKIAILYRASFHGNYIQTALLQRQIPYVVVGGIKFTERRHIKDVIACLRIVLNPFDAVSWNRILKLLPGVGQVTAGKIVATIQEKRGEIDFSSFSKRKYGDSLMALQEMLGQAMDNRITIATKLEVIRNYYSPILEVAEADFEIRLQDVEVLHNIACKYEDLDKFLSDFALDPPSNKFQDRNRPLIDESEDKPVVLSTIHSAKGLEWYTVFVPHLLDGLFPSARALKQIDYIEEERRLFYVACSRAKEQLYLTMPAYMASFDAFYTKPSRFIAEIDNENFEVYNEHY